jgi:hypothetical protein
MFAYQAGETLAVSKTKILLRQAVYRESRREPSL